LETFVCTYELRDHDEVISTGRLTLTEQPAPSSELRLGHERVVVRSVLPSGPSELHLVLERR
jgi:hypothetical protein